MGYKGQRLELKRARQAAFLGAYARSGNVTAAGRQARVGRIRHYRWLETDPQYARRFRQAVAEFADRLFKEALRRSVDGWDEPVYYEGKVCGTRRKFSDRLLELMLRAHIPAFRPAPADELESNESRAKVIEVNIVDRRSKPVDIVDRRALPPMETDRQPVGTEPTGSLSVDHRRDRPAERVGQARLRLHNRRRAVLSLIPAGELRQPADRVLHRAGQPGPGVDDPGQVGIGRGRSVRGLTAVVRGGFSIRIAGA